MSERDSGLHDEPPGIDVSVDDPAARTEMAKLLFGPVPPLAPAEQAEMFRRTFDPATPDPPASLLVGDDVLAGSPDTPSPFPGGDGGGADTVAGPDHEPPGPDAAPWPEPEPEPEPWDSTVDDIDHDGDFDVFPGDPL